MKYSGIEFIYVHGGKFTMGTNKRRADELASIEDGGEFSQESPDSSINTPGFYIARFPVTNAQYAQFVEATGWSVPHRNDELSQPFNWDLRTRRYPEGMDDYPVVLVSWLDASRYCSWLGARLPTEAEWEKAARGPDAREWPWGDDWDPERCNTVESGLKRLMPIGSYSFGGDSIYGVADMSGNHWEWCSSLAYPYPYKGDDGRESAVAIGRRVIRGGAWGNNRYQARCAYRNSAYPDDRGFTIGFRVALSRDVAKLWQVNE